MKKFPIKLCVLTVAAAMSVQLGLPAAAESTVGEISFDYNTEDDNAPVFERVNGNIVCERSERDSTVGDYCLLISSESAGTKNIAASNMNLDTYTKNAYKAEMSFDMRVPYKSRTNIGIYDADVKGEYPGESSGAKYSSAGNFFTISGSDGKLSVNGTDIAAKITNDSGEFDWVHYELSFDFEDKKMSYAALSADESVEYCSESNVDFADAQLSRISGIDTYSWLAGTQAELDNLKLTAYEQDSQTDEGITYSGKTVKMNVSGAESGVLIRAAYENDKIDKAEIYNITFENGTAETELELEYGDTLYLWDSLQGMRPLAKKYTYAADGTHIEGDGFAFKVNLERGNVYNVKLTYKGTIYCERADEMTAGIEMSNSEMTETEYDIAVFGDDVMDITFDGEGELESVIITHLSREAAKLPEWWTIGDSTVAQSGSWANTLALTESGDKVTSDFSNYPSLEGVISKFHNSGSPGRKHASFYSQGMLNDILTNMHPGDVVSISGMGTNDSTSTLEQFMEYNIIYITAIADMGGKVILGSYTPTGNYGKTEGAVYDSDTMTFKGMRTDDYDKAIRRVYEQNKDKDYILGFIDMGADADSMMTADVQNVYNSAVAAGDSEQTARQKANARAEEMMAWWKDYNHYYKDFSEYILPSITEQAAECIKNGE